MNYITFIQELYKLRKQYLILRAISSQSYHTQHIISLDTAGRILLSEKPAAELITA